MGPSNIIRQIAVKLVNGCSIGKLRSIPTNIDGDFLGFYPNDVFFTCTIAVADFKWTILSTTCAVVKGLHWNIVSAINLMSNKTI